MMTGFKEWKSVCDVLERGEQTIILRKGGIAEGREGFLWQHREFFLFPTTHHDHREQLKIDAFAGDEAFVKRGDGPVEIRLFAQILWSADIDNLEVAHQLEAFHVWKNEVIEQRFDYSESKGIRLALLRVFRLKSPWILENSPAFGGCRSWLDLPDPAAEFQSREAVIGDADFAAQKTQLEELLAGQGIPITKFD